VKIKVSSCVEWPVPGDDPAGDQKIIDAAWRWHDAGITPVVVISPTRDMAFYDTLPLETSVGLKAGNVLTTTALKSGDLYNVAGWKMIFEQFRARPLAREYRIENESVLNGGGAASPNFPGYWGSGIDAARFESVLREALAGWCPVGKRFVWMTGFFNPGQLGSFSVQRCLDTQRSIATVVRAVLDARFVTNELAKPPFAPNPGKFPDPKANNDWFSASAKTVADVFADQEHVHETHVYDEVGCGVKPIGRRFWRRDEFDDAVRLAGARDLNITFDPGWRVWRDDLTVIDTWKAAMQ